MHCTINANFKDYIKSKVVLVEENYEFILKSEYFEELLDVNDYMSVFFHLVVSLNWIYFLFPIHVDVVGFWAFCFCF